MNQQVYPGSHIACIAVDINCNQFIVLLYILSSIHPILYHVLLHNYISVAEKQKKLNRE